MVGKDEAEAAAQRVTTPAAGPVKSEIVTDIPSERPTSAPNHDAVGLGGTLGLAAPNMALAIPKRVAGADASELSHDAAFALMHVDGVSTIATIAEVADLPLERVAMCFFELSALGIVTMNDRRPAESVPPESRVKRK
jgi:hypothetical protein